MLKTNINIGGWSTLILATIHKYHGSDGMAYFMGLLAITFFISNFFVKE